MSSFFSNLVGLTLILVICTTKPDEVRKIYLVEDTNNQQWCAFESEGKWKPAVEDMKAMTVATLVYSDDHLARIHITQTDESGDWIVYDRYLLGTQGQLSRLFRRVNVLSSNIRVSENYSIEGGGASKTQSSIKDLNTNQAVNNLAEIWMPEIPIRTSLNQFPFSPLVGRFDFGTGGRLCAKSRP